MWEAAKEDSQHGRPALTELVQRYWQPLYAYALRKGLSPHDAEDATQEFLSQIVNGKLLGNADPAKGKFRSFLLTAWKRFLVDQFRRDHAAKRGGLAATISLDVASGEARWMELQSKHPNPDLAFNQLWATSLIDEAKQRLRKLYSARDRTELLDKLLPCLTQPLKAEEYSQIAHELGCSTSAVKVALHRLRQKFGTTLREVVAETVEDADSVDAEISELLETLRAANQL